MVPFVNELQTAYGSSHLSCLTGRKSRKSVDSASLLPFKREEARSVAIRLKKGRTTVGTLGG